MGERKLSDLIGMNTKQQAKSKANPYTAEDVGCYVDDARGIYCIDAIVDIAESHGFTHDVKTTPTGMPGGYETYADYEFSGELEDEIDDYMNDNYSVEGCYWGRSEQGDWGLWTIEED